MRRTIILMLACGIFLSGTASSQTRRRSPSKPKASASKAAAEKSSAELQAGRQRVAAEIKTLTQFLFLFGGVSKSIESADQAVRSGDASPAAIEQNERNKTKVKESVRNVREGLDQLEMSFRSNPRLRSYFPYVTGLGRIGEMAENQAAANRFDEAGRSLVKVVDQLADALTAMR